MRKLYGWKTSIALFVLYAATVIAVHAQTFTTLVVFDQTNGGSPAGSLIQGLDGNFYGTTNFGGNNNCGWAGGCGTLFRITPSGTLTTLYEFCSQPQCSDGVFPNAALVLTSSGDFYGTTAGDGEHNDGTVFKISRGALTTLYSFCSLPKCADGYGPGQLMQAVDGNFYGTTIEFGAYSYGTVFRITPAGALTTLQSFNGDNGGYPKGGLTQGVNGELYGTTSSGGTMNDEGTIYKVSPKGNFTTEYRFCRSGCSDGDGGFPTGTLVETNVNTFYGTTAVTDGTVFEFSQTGTLTYLYFFCEQGGGCPDGDTPAGLIQGTDGNFYGMALYGGSSDNCTGGCGTIFNIAPNGTFTVLHDFDGTNDGNNTSLGIALLQATNGKFYGLTNAGGSNIECSSYFTGCGTIFSLDIGLGPFVAFVRPFGKVGQTGGILGQGFTGTTSVMLNGVSANFTVVSDTFVRATVPEGATTGYVTVTTPTGVITSNVPFHVIQ